MAPGAGGPPDETAPGAGGPFETSDGQREDGQPEDGQEEDAQREDAPSGNGRRETADRQAEIAGLVDRILPAGESTARARLSRSMMTTVARLATEGTEIVDLKVADSALAEMAEAFRMFQPYRRRRKVTIFGSARTLPDHPAYRSARDLAASLAAADWMVVTGAGPGIMAAGMEGAGRERSMGVNIRLPFEQGANAFIAQDPKLVEMRYFFTRKLMLIKESDGYVVLPGGFGTLDEGYELLTLLQTGKAEPAPVVLLDLPGGTYWQAWSEFLDAEVEPRGLVAPEDRSFFRVTDEVDRATAEVLGFYRNYHSCRWVGDLLVLRLQRPLERAELASLDEAFADIVAHGRMRMTKPLAPERADDDHLELPRLAFRFDKLHYGRLRQLIDALNALP